MVAMSPKMLVYWNQFDDLRSYWRIFFSFVERDFFFKYIFLFNLYFYLQTIIIFILFYSSLREDCGVVLKSVSLIHFEESSIYQMFFGHFLKICIF